MVEGFVSRDATLQLYMTIAGDTLAKVCQKCSVLAGSLLAANPSLTHDGIKSLTDSLAAGKTLQVPVNPRNRFLPGPLSDEKGAASLVRAHAVGLEGRKLLQEPVSILNGVSSGAAEALARHMRVRSVFDLATARPFNGALELLSPADGSRAAAASHGFIPGDLILSDPKALEEPLQILSAGIEELDFGAGDLERSVSAAGALKAALGVSTVRDFALWPPFRAARKLLHSAFDYDESALSDGDAAKALVPKPGNFATERVYYQKVVMWAGAKEGETAKAIDLGKEAGSGLLDPTTVNTADAYLYQAPRFGARVMMEQAWYAQGVTLGHLLQSVTLAPGESTKNAVVDWTRRTAASRSDTTTQIEELSAISDQTRALSEVADSVAHEMNHGESATHSDSTSFQLGMAGAIGSLLGISGGMGKNSGTATSVATTAGSKEVVAQVVQNVQQRTQQHATASRGRRAATVVETSQSEHDVASTRVLTNYNHMHALTIQYYEVLQVYRTSTRALETQPVLFIPVRLINFTDTLIETHKDTLQIAAAALESRSRTRKPGETWSARISAFQPKQIFALVAPRPGQGVEQLRSPGCGFYGLACCIRTSGRGSDRQTAGPVGRQTHRDPGHTGTGSHT
jgi:hypothetical protein